ncbi:10262_t:CDS:2, partial [Gigaspora rosea]
MAYNESLVPIRLHMQTMTILNRHNFILTVVKGNSEHSEQLGYLCNCNSFYNTKPSSSSTNAISMIYQQIFHTKTRFSEKHRFLFLQEIKEDAYKVTIVQKAEIKKIYSDNTPDLMWNKIFNEQEIKITELLELTGKILFGIENDITQQKLQILEIPS